MRIGLLAPSPVPYATGGAERLWEGLRRALAEHSPHDVELVSLPTPEQSLPEVLAGYQAWSELDVSRFDMVVSGKYPGWMVRHPNHVVYMLHTLRGLYDTYPAQLGDELPGGEHMRRLRRALAQTAVDGAVARVFEQFWAAVDAMGRDDPAFGLPSPLARHLVHTLDRLALAPPRTRRHLAISATVAAREMYFPPDTVVEVAVPPSSLAGLSEGRFDYFFTASRLDRPKRLDLLVEAYRRVPGDVPLWIAGTGPEAARLEALAQGDGRVHLLGFVDDHELADLYANALAVPFVPLDEDLGLITLEAMSAGKPVVTVTDSGGPTEFVIHGQNGLVAAPRPDALGAALARLAGNVELARRLGEQGKRTAAAVTWESVAGRLLWEDRSPGAGAAAGAVRRPRRKLVAATTFPVYPRLGGGQVRCAQLFGAMAEDVDIELVSLAGVGTAPTRVVLAPGLVETSVPMSEQHHRKEAEMASAVEVPVTDIAASAHIDLTPAYVEALRRASDGASGVVLGHPFMLPAVDLAGVDVPIVYDAHNAEFQLKSEILPTTDAGRALLDIVADVERQAVARAVVVSVCSDSDRALLVREFGAEEAKFLTVPNGVDAARIRFTEMAARRRNAEHWLAAHQAVDPSCKAEALAVFTGSWHPPNISAAEHIFELAEELPEVLFLLVGSHGDYFGRYFTTPPNVVRMGVVSERLKDTLLGTADVALNPMTRGSGTNLKIVEYFAAGVPVVSTPFGSRGLEVADGEHLRLAEPAAFAEAVRDVLAEPEAAARRTERARALVEERYDWHTLGRGLSARVAAALDNA